MSKNVKIANTTYNAVPSINIPLVTGMGNASFFDVSDTTATAADVFTGKYFYTSAGVRTQGTNSGGGGGATNFVTGTFTTPSSAGHTNLNIPYTGTGYPVMIVVVVEGGAYHSGTDWYNSLQRYAVGQWTCTKSNFTASPTYTTSGSVNQGVVTAIYKNSTSSSTTYTRTSAMNTNVFSSSNASNSAVNTIKYKSGNVLSYYTNTSGYGLHPDIEYRYFIVYSS